MLWHSQVTGQFFLAFVLVIQVALTRDFVIVAGVAWPSVTTPQLQCTLGPATITCVPSSVTSAEACLVASLISRNTSVKFVGTIRIRRSPSLSAASVM